MKSVFNRAPRRPSGFSRLAAGCVPVIAVTTLIAMQSGASAAQAPVNLGTAASFAVLAGTTVTNTGPSTINGDLGVSPGSAVTGFPPGTLNGTQHDADAVALQAQSDLTSAYNDAASRTPAASAPADLSGETLAPGVYKNATSLGLTGTVTLNAEGNPDAVFIFQAGSPSSPDQAATSPSPAALRPATSSGRWAARRRWERTRPSSATSSPCSRSR